MVRSKLGNKKTVLDGIKFDSKAEGRRYLELKMLLNAGKIQDLELQPEFVLQEKFKYKGKTERAIIYRADFKYTEDGETIYEDVKGHKTEIYRLKRKLLLKKFPDINFVEVQA